MLIGYVGKEPEVHYYDTDQCVAFSLWQPQNEDIL